MKIIKQGNLTKQEYKMVCWKCGCEAKYISDDIHHDQRDGDYIVCPCCGSFVYHNEQKLDLMNNEEYKIKGWVAVDKDTAGNRRVSFFVQKPKRDLLTEYHYWVMTKRPYWNFSLDSKSFPELTWENEPIEVELTIKKL